MKVDSSPFTMEPDDSSSSTGDGDELLFGITAGTDLTGVDFESPKPDRIALHLQEEYCWNPPSSGDSLEDVLARLPADVSSEEVERFRQEASRLYELYTMMHQGQYWKALYQSSSSQWFFADMDTSQSSITTRIQGRVNQLAVTPTDCIELEFLALAGLQLYLQINYTGPSLEEPESAFAPHASCFEDLLPQMNHHPDDTSTTKTQNPQAPIRNALFSELAVEGNWPCPVASAPYPFLVARTILEGLVTKDDVATTSTTTTHLWHARALVTQERLFLSNKWQPATESLWTQVQEAFQKVLEAIHDNNDDNRKATVLLEHGLAHYHWDRIQESYAPLIQQAQEASGLEMQVTGAMGKRTKFQKDARAQMVVRAASRKSTPATKDRGTSCFEQQQKTRNKPEDEQENDYENILLDRIQFEDEKENEIAYLTLLDQAILLAHCLDVKVSNPSARQDALTAEQMGAFLARVIAHTDNWMVYSTALLERAWLEFDGPHTKERSLLQLQALADQHTNRLTITQSTKKSIEEESAKVQDRLQHLHSIVYPPRWHMLRDVAERYATLGILTSAAELYAEIESWEEVVECYKRAGKNHKAEEIVRERLQVAESPRLWTALGELKQDPECYTKAIELSKGRFSLAYSKLAEYHFDKGELLEAKKNYHLAVQLRPLQPVCWFRLGTISMQTGDWDTALAAFSEVVQQVPDEADAWANVAAVHMHNKKPAEAYPALNESLKQNRNNWRVWINKLYICLDLKKYDEAIQACQMVLDFSKSHSATTKDENGPRVEEKCVRAIVGGSLEEYASATDPAAKDATRRTLMRTQELLQQLSASLQESWVYEVNAYFYERFGSNQTDSTLILDNLRKEYRSLQTVRNWEKDDYQVAKVCSVVTRIVRFEKQATKSKFLVRSVVNRVEAARAGGMKIPKEVHELSKLLQDLETAE